MSQGRTFAVLFLTWAGTSLWSTWDNLPWGKDPDSGLGLIGFTVLLVSVGFLLTAGSTFTAVRGASLGLAAGVGVSAVVGALSTVCILFLTLVSGHGGWAAISWPVPIYAFLYGQLFSLAGLVAYRFGSRAAD